MYLPLTLSRFLLFIKKIRLVPAFGFSCPVFLPFVINNYIGFDGYYFIIVLGIVLANLFVFLVNDYYDSSYDFHSEEKRERNLFCTTSGFERKILISGLIGLAVTPIVLGFIVSIGTGIMVGLTVGFGVVYSTPPFRGKDRLVLDWFLHAVWILTTFLAAHFYLPIQSPLVFSILIITLFTFSMAIQVRQQIRDYQQDLDTNQKTTATLLGLKKSKITSEILNFTIIFFLFILCFLEIYPLTIIGLSGALVVHLYSLIGSKTSWEKYSPVYKKAHAFWILFIFLDTISLRIFSLIGSTV